MINIHDLTFLKECGLHLTAINPETKKPVDKSGYGKWVEWEPDEIIKHNKQRAGFYHDRFNDHEDFCFLDVDFDDKSLIANQLMHQLPVTLTLGKKPNGSAAIETHATFKIPKELKPKKNFELFDSKGNKIIEVLRSTCTWALGHNRHIIRKKEPVMLDADSLQSLFKQLKIINFVTELRKNWPKEGKRDQAYLPLTGALTRDTDLTTLEKENVTETLCELTNDSEVKNRRDKVKYQEKQFKENPEQVAGIKSLCAALNIPTLKSFDYLKREEGNEEFKEYPLIDGHAYSLIKYPPVKFVMEPIFTERSTSQMFGAKESGKTLVGQALSISIPSGNDFLDYKCVKPMPTGYVEGELPGEDLRARRDTILNDYWDKGKKYKAEWTFTLCRDDLEMAGFPYGFDSIAVARNLSNADAEDYGRKGRKLIENWLMGIEKKTGHKPFLFLDNIQALADIDENRASDWTPLLQWTNHLKHKGFPNCFIHHANKSTGTSSGSSAKERMLDTSISFTKLNPEERLDMPGLKNLQTRVKFDKARNFGGGKMDLPFILTMNEDGVFTKYPNLTKDDFKIIELYKDGNSVKDMAQSKELKIAEKTIYKRLKSLKDMEVIKDEKKSSK
jgi:hypothetical protein